MSAYAGYLANAQAKTDIVAKEDIISDTGALIAKSGTKLNSNTCQKIVKFKLLKPIEDSILLANQLDAKTIYKDITDLVNKDPYLKAWDQKLGNSKVLHQCCRLLERYPLLLQKITVLKLEIAGVYNQSLLSAYLAYLCPYISQRPQGLIEEYFLAGIAHDVGLLHIDHSILSRPGTLSAEEWRTVQSHPVIGYEILRRIPNFPSAAAKATLEHHENIDGSGYPRAKELDDLSKLGQLINLLDNVIAIYNKKFKPLKRSPFDIIPILQISMYSHLASAITCVFKLLHEAPASAKEQSDYAILKELIGYVRQQQHYINVLTQKIKVTIEQINIDNQDKKLRQLQKNELTLIAIMTSAGLDAVNEIDWEQQLDNQCEQQALYEEVENTRLMQEEIIYQLQTYQKNIAVFITSNEDKPFIGAFQELADTFTQTKRPDTPASLKQYWKSLGEKNQNQADEFSVPPAVQKTQDGTEGTHAAQ